MGYQVPSPNETRGWRTVISARWIPFDDVWAFCEDAADRNPHYLGALDHVADSYFAAIRANLRYNRKSNVMRDDSGILARPSEPSLWSEATLTESYEHMTRKIWSGAVRRLNRANK